MVLKHLLSAPETKIRRARKHLAELEAEVEAFIASEPAKFNAEIIEDNGVRTIRWTSEISGAPEEISAIVGDVIHNLRTALDLTACDMVRAAGQSDKDVYFPFSNSAQELNEMILRRHFDRAGADAVALLQSIQPIETETPLCV